MRFGSFVFSISADPSADHEVITQTLREIEIAEEVCGWPRAASTESERTSETTIVQALHLMNSRNLYRKVTADAGRAAGLAKSDRSPAEIVEELYLLVYSRFPDQEELRIGSELFGKEGTDRRPATEDLLWALMNTPEFVFKD